MVNRLKGLWTDADNTKQVIVVHDTEGSYQGAIDWMESQRNGSYHIIVGPNGESTRMVPDNKRAWAAMNTGNRIGLHICASGYAKWSTDKWLSYPKQVDGVAAQFLDWHTRYGIPLVRLSPADIRAGKRGICTHADISRAFGESDHTDPGPNYPLNTRVIPRAIELKKGPAMSAADNELTKKFPSRSKYRASDAAIDTLAGFVLNIDARIHEDYVERSALRGEAWAVALVKREANKGDSGAKAVVAKL